MRKKAEKFQTPPKIEPLDVINLIKESEERARQDKKNRRAKPIPPWISYKSPWFFIYRIFRHLRSASYHTLMVVKIIALEIKKHIIDRMNKHRELFVFLLLALFYTYSEGMNEHLVLAVAILSCVYFSYQILFGALQKGIDLDIEKRYQSLNQLAEITFKGMTRETRLWSQIGQVFTEAKETDDKYKELLKTHFVRYKDFVSKEVVELSASELEIKRMLDRYVSFEDRLSESEELLQEFKAILSLVRPENEDGKLQAERNKIISEMTSHNNLGLNLDRDLPYKAVEKTYTLSDLYRGYYPGHDEHYFIMDDILADIEMDKNGEYIFPPIKKKKE